MTCSIKREVLKTLGSNMADRPPTRPMNLEASNQDLDSLKACYMARADLAPSTRPNHSGRRSMCDEPRYWHTGKLSSVTLYYTIRVFSRRI